MRAFIHERIPAGGTDADTTFTDAELDALLLVPSVTVEEAAFRGWLLKAGEDRGGIIERTIGSERLRFAEPDPTFALKMADYYSGLMPTGGSQLAELDPPDVLGTKRFQERDISRLIGYDG